MILILLKKWMEKRNLNQAALQRKTGIRGGTLSDFVNSRSKMIPMEVLESICAALEIQPADLLVYIPKKIEFQYWKRYANDYYLDPFHELPEEDGPLKDFYGIIDGLVKPSESYYTGRRRQGIPLKDVLGRHNLIWNERTRKLLSMDEYYQTDEAWESQDMDYSELRKALTPYIVGFWDDIDTETEKKSALRRFWSSNDWTLRERDKEHKLPKHMRMMLATMDIRKKSRQDNSELQN